MITVRYQGSGLYELDVGHQTITLSEDEILDFDEVVAQVSGNGTTRARLVEDNGLLTDLLGDLSEQFTEVGKDFEKLKDMVESITDDLDGF